MARVFIDGFEAGDVKLWDIAFGTPVPATTITGMDGTYCVQMTAMAQQYLSKNLTAATEYYIAFRYKPNAVTSGQRLFVFYNNATKLGSMRRNSTTLVLEAYSSSDGLLASSTAQINNSTTYLIEVRFKPNTSGGIWQVKINGALDIDFSGNTGNASNINKLCIGSADSNPGTYAYFDNVIVDNAVWVGNTRIQAIVPTGAGNSTQWTPSAGNNYACVDEVPPSESDFITTNTVDYLDTYATANLSGSIGSIKCVQVQALAKYEGAPTPTNLELAVRSNGENYFSADKEVLTTSTQLSAIWETDPDTEAAWTESGVNAMEIGIKAVA
jgi:hypothetical protein